MMVRRKSADAPLILPVRIERNGVVHEGTYSVNGPMITVTSVMLGSKTVQIGGTPPEVLAKIILAELLFMNEERKSR